MSITAGTRFGPYEIVAPIGAGGMGEVYQARDTRLDRAVALKVLSETFATDPSFLDRFEREARAISSLNHPNICSLYDVGSQDGMRYLVMELLEGETLASRLARGPLPLDEALRYAVQTADALSRAHRQGIVHRDLKPGNVMLTKHGAKLLDFGLARVDAPMPGRSGVTLAPTQERPLTAVGTILGTFQYMAPEQLEGREADARTDIFAFGALLYEMITGRKAFSGGTQASLIASIMSGVPPAISTVQPMTPPALERVVHLCLAKDPENRWQTTQDLAAELKWIAEGGSHAGAPAAVGSRRRSREWLAWTAAAVCGLAAVAALARVLTLPTPAGREPTRFAIPPPKGVVLSWPRISPDGRIVAFVGESQGVRSIWIRRLGSLDPVRLPGTEGVLRPFWSPDSNYLAYFADGRLKKIAVSGGSPQLIAEDGGGDDGAWSAAGVILFDGDGLRSAASRTLAVYRPWP
jgi:eukaryotic-like serine/threonine-protein kinase